MNFCWHKYGKWSDPIQTHNSGHKQQWRVCQHCNKAQFRTLRWDTQSYLRDVLDALKTARGNT